MLKKTITYNDLDGNPLTEDFYFNLSKAELAEMELSQDGGMLAYLKYIVASKDGAGIMMAFKKILTQSVGRRSDDGKRFMKSPQITEEFMQTDAYSVLFMELVTDAEASSAFIRGIVPSDLSDKVMTDVQLPDVAVEGTIADNRPRWLAEDREPTNEELMKMSKSELVLALASKTRS